MATIRKFEDIKALQKARNFWQWLNPVIEKILEKRNYRLSDQLEGFSGSMKANIAEGFERGSKKEFITFFKLCKSFLWKMPLPIASNIY